jgi:hypothetical protein
MRTEDESERARSTHVLESTEEGTNEDIKESERKRGSLTSWRPQKEGRVRARKESERGPLTT